MSRKALRSAIRQQRVARIQHLLWGALLAACASQALEAQAASLPEPPMAPAVATAPGTPMANVAPVPAISVEKPGPSKNIFFPPGETTIPSGGSDTLADIAQELQADRRLTVLLVGHASITGSKEYCVAVAARQTSAVNTALLELGVLARQIRRRSLGCEPLSRGDCDSDECRLAESRVELQFVGAEK